MTDRQTDRQKYTKEIERERQQTWRQRQKEIEYIDAERNEHS